MTGYRLCTSPLHQGRRWIPCLYFHVRRWRADKSEPERLQSHCQCCQRMRNRSISRGKRFPYQQRRHDAYVERLQQAKINRLSPWHYKYQVRRQRRRNYHDRVDPRLPVEPFRAWLYRCVMENSITGVAANVGVSARRIATFLNGSYSKNGKLYPIKHVRYSTVERWMNSFGDTPALIYHPEIIEKYRAIYHDARKKPR